MKVTSPKSILTKTDAGKTTRIGLNETVKLNLQRLKRTQTMNSNGEFVTWEEVFNYLEVGVSEDDDIVLPATTFNQTDPDEFDPMRILNILCSNKKKYDASEREIKKVSWEYREHTVHYTNKEEMSTDMNFLIYLVAKRGYQIKKLFPRFSQILKKIILLLQQKYQFKREPKTLGENEVTLRQIVKLFPINYLSYFHEGDCHTLVTTDELGLPKRMSKAWLCPDIVAVIPKNFQLKRDGELLSVHPLAFHCRVLVDEVLHAVDKKKTSLRDLYRSYLEEYDSEVTSQEARISFMRDRLECIDPNTGVFYEGFYEAAESAFTAISLLRSDDSELNEVLTELKALETTAVNSRGFAVEVDTYWREYALWMKSGEFLTNHEIDKMIEGFQKPEKERELLNAACLYIDDDLLRIEKFLRYREGIFKSNNYPREVVYWELPGGYLQKYTNKEPLLMDMDFILIYANRVNFHQRIIGMLTTKYEINWTPNEQSPLRAQEVTYNRIQMVFPFVNLWTLHELYFAPPLSHADLFLPGNASCAWFSPEIATAIPAGVLRITKCRSQSVHPLAFLCHILTDNKNYSRAEATPLDYLFSYYTARFNCPTTKRTTRIANMKKWKAISPQTGIFYKAYYDAAERALDEIVRLKQYDPMLEKVLDGLKALK